MMGRRNSTPVDEHECTGSAPFSGGTVPCPCCGPKPPHPFCDRCGNPFVPGDGFETIVVDRPTGGGVTVVLHKPLCKPLPADDHPPVWVRRSIREG